MEKAMTKEELIAFEELNYKFYNAYRRVQERLKLVDSEYNEITSWQLFGDVVDGEGFGYMFGDEVHYEKAFPKELLYSTDEELEKYALDLAEKLKKYRR